MQRKWLKDMRLEKKMTQEDVAVKSGIERSYYNMVENGKRKPSVDVAQAIGHALGFDWTLFFTQKGNETTLKQKVAN